MADKYVIVDGQNRLRTAQYDTQQEAIDAGAGELLLVDDLAWSVMIVRTGRPLGSENYDSIFDTYGYPQSFQPISPGQVIPDSYYNTFLPAPYRFCKTGEIRFVDGEVVFNALAQPDGQKRAD